MITFAHETSRPVHFAPTSHQLLISAVGLRHPSLRWAHILPYFENAQLAEAFVRFVKRADEWPRIKSAMFPKILEPRSCLEIAESDLLRLDEIGAKVLTPFCPDYPEYLEHYPEKPIILTYLGSPFWVNKFPLSIVGSRNPRSDTLRWLDHELPLVARIGIPFVSGGARGVDQRVHGIAIRCGVPTGVILPSGLARLYPSDLKLWMDNVLEGGGAFVSEFAPDLDMRRHHFLQRNRIVAAMSKATLIAQCGSKSGTWITANYALNFRSEGIGVVPGSAWDAQFNGSHDLIQQGAAVVKTSLDIFALINVDEYGRPFFYKVDESKL